MLSGKVSLVTGASKGIGWEITQVLAQYGSIVFANTRDIDSITCRISDLDENIRKNIVPIYFDLRDEKSIKNAILSIKKKYSNIDVLVNNAAVNYNENIGMISTTHMEEMFKVNVIGMINCIQYARRIMKNGGSIINISSIVGRYGDAGQVAYSASKGAVLSLTMSAAKELAEYGIRVNSVAPGLTKTDMFDKTDPKYLEKRLNNIGFKRVAIPRDIANAVLFLASDLSNYITGEIIGVDGGSII